MTWSPNNTCDTSPDLLPTGSVSRSCDFAQKWRFLPLLCALIFAICAKRKNRKKWRFWDFQNFM